MVLLTRNQLAYVHENAPSLSSVATSDVVESTKSESKSESSGFESESLKTWLEYTVGLPLGMA